MNCIIDAMNNNTNTKQLQELITKLVQKYQEENKNNTFFHPDTVALNMFRGFIQVMLVGLPRDEINLWTDIIQRRIDSENK